MRRYENLQDLFSAVNALKNTLQKSGPRANEVLAVKLGPRQTIGASILRLGAQQQRYRETIPHSVLRAEVRRLRDQKERDPQIRYSIALWEMGRPDERHLLGGRGRSLLQIWCTENGFTSVGDQCARPKSWPERCDRLRQYGGDWLEWDEWDESRDQGYFHMGYLSMLKHARQRWKAGALFTIEDPDLQRTIWGFDDPAEAAAIRDDLLRVWVRGSV